MEGADFYSYLSGYRNLQVVAALKGGVSRSAIEEVLAIAGLSERASDKVKTYSHGMRQRLGIAQALLGWPEFIILDEPTSGLDPQGIKEVRELIGRLSAERSMTIFLSSHLLNEIEQMATSMAIINEAKVVVQGEVQDLLSSADNVVEIDARPIEKAISLIESQRFVYGMKRNGQFLEVRMPLQQVSSLNVQLVNAGLEVHALIPRRSLEEYFLSITEQASSVPVSPQRRLH